MACFLVSVAEAAVVSVVNHFVPEKKDEGSYKISMKTKLKWLSGMLWGGSALLALEHVWHGEIIATPPFLSAMKNAEDAATMFHEMATVGVCMALLITSVWVIMCLAADRMAARAHKSEPAKAAKEASR